MRATVPSKPPPPPVSHSDSKPSIILYAGSVEKVPA
jgi:hypothetical protein